MRVSQSISIRLTCVALCALSVIPAAQTGKNPAVTALPAGQNVLWQDPGDVEAKDLVWGAGGEANQPQAPYQFLKEELSGTTPKIQVKDAKGITWVVKFGEEAKPSAFATRLIWACGYTVEIEYLVPQGTITGVRGLKRAAAFVHENGSFIEGRFQMRADHPKFVPDHSWAWNSNPFLGTPELNGLRILVMLLSNWDTKDARDLTRGGEPDSNLAIFEDSDANGPRYLYFISDWGASLGNWGGVAKRSKMDCKGFAAQTPDFVQGSEGGVVRWGYSGKHNDDIVKNIRVSDVQWLMQYLGRITDDQLRQGLAASGATPEQMECFLRSLRQRIDQLRALQK